MTEKQRTFEADVHTLQKMNLQRRSAKEKAALEPQDNPLPEETLSLPVSVPFSREVLLRLINRLKHS
jgi:hypothetical protein